MTLKEIIFFDGAGLISVCPVKHFYIHFLPLNPEFWYFGHSIDEFDGIDFHNFGLGPLLLVCWGPIG